MTDYVFGDLTRSLFGLSTENERPLDIPIIECIPDKSFDEFEVAEPSDDEIEKKVEKKRRTDPDVIRRSIILTNVNVKSTAREIRHLLGLTPGDIEKVVFSEVPRKPESHKPWRYCLQNPHKYCVNGVPMLAVVILKSERMIEAALAKSKSILHKNVVFIHPVPEGKKFSVFDRRRTVFVGRLGSLTRENWLYENFSKVGIVESVRILRDAYSNTSKGYGFVLFENKDSVGKSIKWSRNILIDGHPIRVEFAAKETKIKHDKNLTFDEAAAKRVARKPIKLAKAEGREVRARKREDMLKTKKKSSKAIPPPQNSQKSIIKHLANLKLKRRHDL